MTAQAVLNGVPVGTLSDWRQTTDGACYSAFVEGELRHPRSLRVVLVFDDAGPHYFGERGRTPYRQLPTHTLTPTPCPPRAAERT